MIIFKNVNISIIFLSIVTCSQTKVRKKRSYHYQPTGYYNPPPNIWGDPYTQSYNQQNNFNHYANQQIINIDNFNPSSSTSNHVFFNQTSGQFQQNNNNNNNNNNIYGHQQQINVNNFELPANPYNRTDFENNEEYDKTVKKFYSAILRNMTSTSEENQTNQQKNNPTIMNYTPAISPYAPAWCYQQGSANPAMNVAYSNYHNQFSYMNQMQNPYQQNPCYLNPYMPNARSSLYQPSFPYPQNTFHDPCLINPCKNQGSCQPTQMTSYGFICTCKQGFTGSYCNSIIDPCQSQPCKNNADCTYEVDNYYSKISFTCHCNAAWFSGKLCQNDHINGNQVTQAPTNYNCPCKNNRPCNQFGACDCGAQFTGPLCQSLNHMFTNGTGNGNTNSQNQPQNLANPTSNQNQVNLGQNCNVTISGAGSILSNCTGTYALGQNGNWILVVGNQLVTNCDCPDDPPGSGIGWGYMSFLFAN